MPGNDSQRYSAPSRAIHWLTAVLVFVMIGLGVTMEELEKGDPLRSQLFMLHMSTGVLIVMLTLLRLGWLVVSPGPALPAVLAGWERALARLVKWLLYLGLFAVPAAGYLIAASDARPVPFYGLFEIPPLVAENHDLHELMEEVHEVLAWTLLALVGLHVAGALKHRFLDRNPEADVLGRML